MNGGLVKRMRRHAELLKAQGISFEIKDEESGEIIDIYEPSEDEIYKEIQRRVSTGMIKPEEIPEYE